MEISLYFLVFAISGFLTYLIQKIFIKFKRFDDFNHRSSHNTLATRTGGIGVFITLFCVSAYFYLSGIEIFDYSLFIPIGIMFIVGAYDDLYNADFKLKFLLQIIVAKIIIDQGYAITSYHGLFGIYELPWIIAQLSTIFVFLIIINAINFIDGIDGLAITEIIKIIFIIELFSLEFTPLAPLGYILIASLLPLYYFNFKNKCKVFLGDGGSLLLGTIIAIYSFYILGNDFNFMTGVIINKTLFSVLILLYPLVDLLRVFIIRIKNGESPFKPDRNHLHHILISRGFSHFSINIILIIFNLLIFIFLWNY